MDENGHGGGGALGEWMSTFQYLPKYDCVQDLKYLDQSGAVTIYGGQSSVNGETNVFKFSSSTERI